ncbi:hypothetical protein HWV62_15675 [Athelia sp. TMB]|nr:hypothetical protein HWV62_15675 [Athelia sp. TMB]
MLIKADKTRREKARLFVAAQAQKKLDDDQKLMSNSGSNDLETEPIPPGTGASSIPSQLVDNSAKNPVPPATPPLFPEPATPSLFTEPASSDAPSVLKLRLRKIIKTPCNVFGLVRQYFSHRLPTSDPESLITLNNLSSVHLTAQPGAHSGIPTETSASFKPYPNKNSWLLGNWFWNGSTQKSHADFKDLRSIIGDPEYSPSDIRDTKWDKINAEIGEAMTVMEEGHEEWLDEDKGWMKKRIKISVPFAKNMARAGSQEYSGADLYHRSLVDVLKERISNPHAGQHIHMEPFKLNWQPTPQHSEVRIHGEMYTSEAFLDAHEALQQSSPEPGCELEKCIAAIMFWSDATHLTSFGNKIQNLGMVLDRKERISRQRVDDDARNRNITTARRFIYVDSLVVDSAAVEKLLKPQSLVPTLPLGFDLFLMLVIDMLHEFELGVWKWLFIHLLRMLACQNASLLHELDHSILTQPYNGKILRLLFNCAHWHGLAKLRLHSDITLDIMDDVTTLIREDFRHSVSKVCPHFDTKELPREAEARGRREAKKAQAQAPTTAKSHSNQERAKKQFNIQRYKHHVLGDYVWHIRRFGTTDSYTSAIGEGEHRTSKRSYPRTDRKLIELQLARIDRRKANLRRIGEKVYGASETLDTEIAKDASAAFSIGKSEKLGEKIGLFLARNKGDPAVEKFLPKLREHMLPRIQSVLLKEDDNRTIANLPDSDPVPHTERVFFQAEKLFRHNIVGVNYTTYDVRRKRDTFNPRTLHKDIMVLSVDEDKAAHPYHYARIIGVFHVNVMYTGTIPVDFRARPLEFLWVRWFERVDNGPCGWTNSTLDRLQFPPMTHESSFSFLDPADVLQASHIVPAFANGPRYNDGIGLSNCAKDCKDYRTYYAMRTTAFRTGGGGGTASATAEALLAQDEDSVIANADLSPAALVDLDANDDEQREHEDADGLSEELSGGELEDDDEEVLGLHEIWGRFGWHGWENHDKAPWLTDSSPSHSSVTLSPNPQVDFCIIMTSVMPSPISSSSSSHASVDRRSIYVNQAPNARWQEVTFKTTTGWSSSFKLPRHWLVWVGGDRIRALLKVCYEETVYEERLLYSDQPEYENVGLREKLWHARFTRVQLESEMDFAASAMASLASKKLLPASSRLPDDIRSDGSRIEGSHKGWNSLQRSFASGIVMILALAHDFVLRRNSRISVDHAPSLFKLSAHGSHHIFLVNHVAQLFNVLRTKEHGSSIPALVPELRIVNSGEEFGLVKSDYATSFKGLIAMKKEDEEEDLLPYAPDYNTNDVDQLLRDLHIDPALLLIPEHHTVAQPSRLPVPPATASLAATAPTTPIQAIPAVTISNKRKGISLGDSKEEQRFATAPGGKRSRTEADGETPQVPEVMDVEMSEVAEQTAGESGSSIKKTIDRYFPGTKTLSVTPTSTTKPSSTLVQAKATGSVDVFSLPVDKSLQNLTKSQRLFTLGTGINVRALKISGDIEFFLFMTMREERQWASFKMTPTKWAVETKLYNTRLVEYPGSTAVVLKHPRALLEKLSAVQTDIIKRLRKNDYKARSNGDSETFWRKACSAVPLVKIEEETGRTGTAKSRAQQKCNQCCTLKYPGPTGAPENHKKAFCADGIAPKLSGSASQNTDPVQQGRPTLCISPEWPQPQGIFTEGKFFHPSEFLAKLREVYEQVVVDREQGSLELENTAFLSLLQRRTITIGGDSIMFKMYDLDIPNTDTMPSEMLIEHEGAKYLRLDCLKESSERSAAQ